MNTSATTTTPPIVNEELAAKKANTEMSETTRVQNPVGSRTKRAAVTVTAITTTVLKDEGVSSVNVKPSEATGIKKEHVDERKEDNIPSDEATCIEG